jgi:type IV secretory pathway VirB6-like protein
MRDEVLEKLRKLNLTARTQSWADRWLDTCLNALFAGMVLSSIIGLIYLFTRT